MKRGNRDASHWNKSLRVALVLMTLTLLVLVSGCALRGNHNSTAGQSGQQATGQSTGTGSGASQGTGSNSAVQQVQSADQQVQDALSGMDSAQNDANSADTQSSQVSNIVP